jgi:hypothetical protein
MRGLPATPIVDDRSSVSYRLFFVPAAVNTLIGLRHDTGKRRMTLCKPPLLSANSR